MGELRTETRAAARSLAKVLAGFGAAGFVFWSLGASHATDRLHEWWWRGHDDWRHVAFGFLSLDRLGHAIADVGASATVTALLGALALTPLVLLARSVVRTTVLAGSPDPFERVRGWVRDHPRALAVLPLAWALNAVRDVHYWVEDAGLALLLWDVAIWGAVALPWAIALHALLKRAVAVVFAPPLDAAKRPSAAVEKDEIGFNAVAVTRETRTAVGVMAALGVGINVWLAQLPLHPAHGRFNILPVLALYVALALGGAALFRRASRVAVGVDGVLVKGTSRTRFFAYRDLDAARANGRDLELVRGDRVVLRLQLHGDDAGRRDAVLARMREAIDRVKEGRGAVAAQMVSAASADQLTRVAGGGADYRGAALTREQLWALVEGPEIEASARRAAAEALVRTGDSSERARLRVAAEHCAAPDVRGALEQLAEAEAKGEAPEAALSRRSA
jgi:hypothetical protein